VDSTIFFWIDMLGIAAFALSGYLAAVRQGLDWLGVFLIAFMTALGGGIMRDVVVGSTPFAFSEGYPAFVVLGVVVFALALRLHRIEVDRHRLFVLSDAVGLSSFAITGAVVAIGAGLSAVGVLLVALITAVGGGMLRDIVLNRVPVVLTSEFYGSVALVVGLMILALDRWMGLSPLMMLGVFATGVALRMAAYRYGWRLPVPS
jgi:uncharacterized membrane protein YeiH